MHFLKKLLPICCAAFTLAAVLCACGSNSADMIQINSPDDIHGVNYGILSGSNYDVLFQENFSDNTPMYFNSNSDMVVALRSGKIDCFNIDNLSMDQMLKENPDITALPQSAKTEYIAAAFPKDSPQGDRLRSEFDEFLTKKEAGGTLEAWCNDWIENYDTIEIPQRNFSGANGVLTVTSPFDTIPLSFIRDGQRCGFEVDLFEAFCEEYGYRPEYLSQDFSGVIPSITTGKADLAICSLFITPEREETISFSKPYAGADTRFIVRKPAVQEPFFKKMYNSFRKTFITDNRWQMLANGLLNTVLLSLLSAVAGSVCGYLLYLSCRDRNPGLRRILNGMSWIVKTLPIVIFLMILFYIVFGSSSLSGFWISAIAFTLTTAMAVYTALSSAISSVGDEQAKAACSLGFTDAQAFRKVILPQAMEKFLPAYQGILTGLVKGTAIVGYIAVNDLTRMSDIIRSQTYEAFFPLIATSLIYALLCRLLVVMIRRITRHTNPRMRTTKEIMRQFR